MKMRLTVNMAITADGKIATANRKISSFGSAVDKRHLLELRATADAVMAGARTIDSSPVTMGPGPTRYRRLRVSKGLGEYNLRIIVSRRATVNPNAKIFRHTFSPILVLTTGLASRERVRALQEYATVKSFGRKEINFKRALEWLHEKWGVRHLLCEGGGELNDALFRVGLVDELHLTICPFVFGGRNAPTISDGLGAPSLADAAQLRLKSSRRVGDELFLVYRRA